MKIMFFFWSVKETQTKFFLGNYIFCLELYSSHFETKNVPVDPQTCGEGQDIGGSTKLNNYFCIFHTKYHNDNDF